MNDKTNESLNNESLKEKKHQRFLRAKKRRKIANTIMGVIVFCGLLGVLSGVNIINIILDKTDVVLETDELASEDSSIMTKEIKLYYWVENHVFPILTTNFRMSWLMLSFLSRIHVSSNIRDSIYRDLRKLY